MPTHNSKFHTIKDGVITLHSKHLGDVVEVHVNKDKRRFYGIREDGTKIEYRRLTHRNYSPNAVSSQCASPTYFSLMN